MFDKRILDGIRKCIGTNQNAEIFPIGMFAETKLSDFFDDFLSLGVIVFSFEEGNRGAMGSLRRPELFFLAPHIVGDNRIRRSENAAGRTIIPFELYFHKTRMVGFEALDIAVISAPPGINRLIIVAHDTDISAF